MDKICGECKERKAVIFSESELPDDKGAKFCYCEDCYSRGQDKIKEHMRKQYGDYEKKLRVHGMITEIENCLCGVKIPKVFMFGGSYQLCASCQMKNRQIGRGIKNGD